MTISQGTALRSAAPAVLVFVILAMTAAFTETIGLHHANVPILITHPRSSTEAFNFSIDLQCRVTYGLSTVAYAFLISWMTLASLSCVIAMCGSRSHAAKWTIAGATAAGFLAATIVMLRDPAIVDPDHSIQRLLLSRIPPASPWNLGLDPTIALAASCAPIAMWVAALGAIMTKSASHGITIMQESARRLRWLSYLAAATLVAGSIRVHALYLWPQAVAPEHGDEVASLARTLASACGGIYTMILMAGVAPVYFFLSSQVRALARTECPPHSTSQDSDAWIAAHGMGAMNGPLPRTLLITLAPLLSGLAVGPASDLLLKNG